MPHWVVSKLADALNDRCKSIKGSKVLVLGIAYKKDVDDMRESPSVELMEILREKGADIAYSDPHVPIFPKMREHFFELKSIALTAEAIGSYDVVLLATDHRAFNYDLIQKNAKLIIDTRGVYLKPMSNVIKA
jgi:UDP-N-acetyl-D-glucosamine dehydrogenase